jgi:polysaccharide biosynthesis protein PslA
MTDAQLNMLLLDPPAAEPWSSAAAKPARPRQARRVLSGRMVSDTVMLFDLAAVLGAGVASYEAYLGHLIGQSTSPDRAQYVLAEALAALFFAVLCQYQRAYRLDRLADLPRQLRAVVGNLLLAVAALAVACFLAKVSASFSRGWALLWIVSAGAVLIAGRCGVSAGVRRLIRAGYLRRRCALIGDGPALAPLLEALREGGEEPAEVLGVFPFHRAGGPAGATPHAADSVADLVAMLRLLPLDEIVIAIPDGGGGGGAKALIERLKVLPVDIRVSLPSIVHHLPVRGTSMIGGLPLIDVAVGPLKHWQMLLKASFDRVAALILLVLFAPILLVVALLIKLDSRGPVFFVQDRFGFNNNVIRVIKFRTMHVEKADPSGSTRTVRGDVRVTRVGRVLRAHSLDELPQLLNVLCGEMSLVGPRPHALAMKAGGRLYHEVVSDYFARHRVKPGITGWAQVSKLRGEIASLQQAQQRVEYDLHYIENWSFWLDLKILLKSAKEMLRSENAV